MDKSKNKSETSNKLTNRHIARLLNGTSNLANLPHLEKTAIIQQMHFLAEDIEKSVLSSNEVNIKENSNDRTDKEYGKSS